jgi:hypothetical protein
MSAGFHFLEARFIHELWPRARALRDFVLQATLRGWHRFYSAGCTLIVSFVARTQMTLVAPRHYVNGHLFNRLNHHKPDRHIPAISPGGLSHKPPAFVMNASDCSPIAVKKRSHGLVARESVLRQSVAVASAHKSALQSYSGFLCLKTRFKRES